VKSTEQNASAQKEIDELKLNHLQTIKKVSHSYLQKVLSVQASFRKEQAKHAEEIAALKELI
jgi:hypothetical protein